MKIQVKKSDLKWRTFRASGPGGQHRNKTESAVEVVHLPTGIKATSSLKSQIQNRKIALKVLVSRLQAYYTEQLKPKVEVNAERIRTYHEPDNRVIDHASGLTMSYREVVEKNNLGPMIEARKAVKDMEAMAARGEALVSTRVKNGGCC